MLKKCLAFLLVLALVFCFAACGENNDVTNTDNDNTPVSSVVDPTNPNAVNQLTGIQNLEKGKENLRPVAIMVDNDGNAQQDSQSGLSKADIVYETETEGGITRLMAVFKDVNSMPQVGDIRSARYVYVDLAMGHNAIFVHSGKEPTYCAAHLKDLDNFEISYNYYGKRIHYGSVFSWQELFTDGETLSKGFSDKNWKTTAENMKSWQNFASEKESVTLSGGTANKVTAAFNSSFTSYFTYDATTGNYVKTGNKAINKDRNDGSKYAFKNVIILKTSMGYYPKTDDPKDRRKIDLVSGEGYYAVNGTYTKIKWKKGNSNDALVFMNTDGTPLKMNAGNTWVCIQKLDSSVTFE